MEEHKEIEEFLIGAIAHLEKSIFKRSYKHQVNMRTTIEVIKHRDKGFVVNIYKDDLLIEIPSSKTLEEIIDLIVEYS